MKFNSGLFLETNKASSRLPERREVLQEQSTWKNTTSKMSGAQISLIDCIYSAPNKDLALCLPATNRRGTELDGNAGTLVKALRSCRPARRFVVHVADLGSLLRRAFETAILLLSVKEIFREMHNNKQQTKVQSCRT